MLDGNLNFTLSRLLTAFGAIYGFTQVYYWWRDRLT